MAELFSETGLTEDVAISAPTLQGLFVPGIDNPYMADGLGLVTPWGSGGTVRTYQDYGPASAGSSSDTQLRDLASAYPAAGGISYNLEGLVGPQGPAGPQGPPGVTTIQQVLLPYSVGLTSLDDLLQQVSNWGATADTIIYGGGSGVDWYEPWESMPVAAIKTWNESATDEDGSFMLIASDSGIYVSTDTGSTWVLKTPDSDYFMQVTCADASGKAVSLADSGSDYGKIWTTTDSGANWSEVSLAL